MKKAIIIGAGPAGVTAAYELLNGSDIQPIIYEKENYIGGISATREVAGNKVDLGPHRFFTKSDRVLNLWQEILPLQGKPTFDDVELEHNPELSKDENAPDPEKTDKVLLKRNRLTRIYYLKKFFDYPVTLSMNTIFGLGLFKMIKIGFSYGKSLVFKKKETNLENFLINRFGKELYLTFFKDYTEKLWGISCSEISAEWGAQRIKGISISKIFMEILSKMFSGKKHKTKETSLIDAFFYPKLGAGQMYEEIARTAVSKGAEIHLGKTVKKINVKDGKVVSVVVADKDGKEEEVFGDYFLSSMPIQELITDMGDAVPEEVRAVSDGLLYRDLRLGAVVLKKLTIKNKTAIKTYNDIIPDVWIYIQEKGVKMGRMEIINNFSPYLMKDVKNEVCLTLEYFCNEKDDIWKMSEDEFLSLIMTELEKMGIADKKNFISGTSFKIYKAYPAYFGSYKDFGKIKDFLNTIGNLYPMGRNGMHHYNNMDHSVLSAMITADNIKKANPDKETIWLLNTEKEYHEEKK
ncbi:MAG: NAD(P)/FAD-dependent oxidoreductase [Alphaproteobacteria bacterium]|nr:NAD(P)/FAD-dependent oxidoreductase [Alphaproteobacteria bacterium]